MDYERYMNIVQLFAYQAWIMGVSAAFVHNAAGILHNTLVSAIYHSIKLPFNAEVAEQSLNDISGCSAKNVKISGFQNHLQNCFSLHIYLSAICQS